jgi:hypothetical protein
LQLLCLHSILLLLLLDARLPPHGWWLQDRQRPVHLFQLSLLLPPPLLLLLKLPLLVQLFKLLLLLVLFKQPPLLQLCFAVMLQLMLLTLLLLLLLCSWHRQPPDGRIVCLHSIVCVCILVNLQ